jgi:thioredoxin
MKRKGNILDLETPDIDIGELISSSDVVVLDFWAPWCVPCHSINMLVEKIARRCPSILFIKINLDTAPEMGSKLGVMSVPTILIFAKRRLVTRLSGILEANTLDKKLFEIVGRC